MRGSIAWSQPHRVTEVWIQAIRELGYPGCDLIKLNLQHRPQDCVCFFAGSWSKQQLMPAFSDLPSLFRTNILKAHGRTSTVAENAPRKEGHFDFCLCGWKKPLKCMYGRGRHGLGASGQMGLNLYHLPVLCSLQGRKHRGPEAGMATQTGVT